MKVVILCGGDNLRFKNSPEETSKSMSLVGDRPLLWHIMNHYSKFGFKDFILCVKDRESEITNYFKKDLADWKVQIAKTGDETQTGGRLKLIENLIDTEDFFVTYGDGLSDVDLNKLKDLHIVERRLATLTAVKPFYGYGLIEIGLGCEVVNFREKPQMKDWVNGGFFVFNKGVFAQLDGAMPLETGLLALLASKRELTAFFHHGQWKSIDTKKDLAEINELWFSKKDFWK